MKNVTVVLTQQKREKPMKHHVRFDVSEEWKSDAPNGQLYLLKTPELEKAKSITITISVK